MKTRNYIKKQCYGLVLHNTATYIYYNWQTPTATNLTPPILSHPTSVDSPASNDGQRNHTAYVRQNLPPLYDALRESRPIQNLYSP